MRDTGLRALLQVALAWADCQAMLKLPREQQPLVMQSSLIQPHILMAEIRQGIRRHLASLQEHFAGIELPPVRRASRAIPISVSDDLKHDLVETITRLRQEPANRTLVQEQVLRSHKRESAFRQQILLNRAARKACIEGRPTTGGRSNTGTRKKKERIIPLVPALPLRASAAVADVAEPSQPAGHPDSVPAPSARRRRAIPPRAARPAANKRKVTTKKARKKRSSRQADSDTDGSVELGSDSAEDETDEGDEDHQEVEDAGEVPPAATTSRRPAPRPIYKDGARARQQQTGASLPVADIAAAERVLIDGDVAEGEPAERALAESRSSRASVSTVLRPPNNDSTGHSSLTPAQTTPITGPAADMPLRETSTRPTLGAPKRKRNEAEVPPADGALAEAPALGRGKRAKRPNTLFDASTGFQPS